MDALTDIIGRAPATVVHGDFHCQNISFDESGAARLIDFQFVQRGAAVLVVARFLATSLTTEVRRAEERDLLRRYHLRRAALGAPEDEPDAELTALRAGLLWNIAMPLSLHVRRVMMQGRPWPEKFPILTRCLDAARDWDALAVLD